MSGPPNDSSRGSPAATPAALSGCFAKTEAGRTEIKSRGLALPRSARNLLLVIDAGKTAQQWLSLVQGVSAGDFQALIDAGLIAAVGGGGAPVQNAPNTPNAANVPNVQTAQEAPATPAGPAAPSDSFGNPPQLDYAQLYAYLSGPGSQLLGTFKRYAFVLEVERCNGLAELQLLGLDLVDRVRQSKGDVAAAAVRAAIGLQR